MGSLLNAAAGVYSAWWKDADYPAVCIQGPNGIEEFCFEILPAVDLKGALCLNSQGQLAGWGEATGDSFGFYAVYGYGGGRKEGWGPGFGPDKVMPGEIATASFGALGFDKNSPLSADNLPLAVQPTHNPQVLRIDEDGAIHGVVCYGVSGSGLLRAQAIWRLGCVCP